MDEWNVENTENTQAPAEPERGRRGSASLSAWQIILPLLCLVLGIALGAGAMFAIPRLAAGPAGKAKAVDPEIQAGAEKYKEIMELVEQYYIASDDLDMTEVNDAMASGVIAGLGDRWSYYVPAEEYLSYQNNISNSYVGVGITIQANLDDGGVQSGFMVNEVSAGGSAMDAGVEAGYILVAVDGEDVRTMTVTEVKKLVVGDPGTTVELTFQLPDGSEQTMKMERRAMTVIPARGELLENGVGYIKIDNFDGGCFQAVQEQVESLRAQGATALLFDVRNNPGGLKSELTDLLDYLLPEGVIFHTINYAGDEDIILSDESCVEMPMAVLVNANSYSAAEYFACALQEYGAGVVVGEQTFGKGYYQVGLNLSDGSCVNLSIGKYFTPQGESLIDVGVSPDVEVLLDDEQALQLASGKLAHEDDPQMQAALDALLK